VTIADFAYLYDYGHWANGKLFEVLAELTPEEFTRDVAGSYGSVRNTFVHLLSAEWGWIDRCGGAPRGGPLQAADYPTVESVVAAARQIEGHVDDFLATLTDDDVVRPVEFSLGGGPKKTRTLGQLLHHAATHGVHHRGQLVLLLRSLGQGPGNIDLIVFDASNDAG